MHRLLHASLHRLHRLHRLCRWPALALLRRAGAEHEVLPSTFDGLKLVYLDVSDNVVFQRQRPSATTAWRHCHRLHGAPLLRNSTSPRPTTLTRPTTTHSPQAALGPRRRSPALVYSSSVRGQCSLAVDPAASWHVIADALMDT